MPVFSISKCPSTAQRKKRAAPLRTEDGEIMAESVIVVKLGGTEGVDFSAICNDAAELLKQGKRLAFVHGGSAEANALGKALGAPPKMITSPSGYTSRYTDRKTL